MGLSRPILICNNKKGSQGKFFVVALEATCRNFRRKTTISRPRKPPLPDTDGARYIPLTQGKFAIVDADDYERLAKYKWHCRRAKNHFYAFRADGPNIIAMHREITGAPKGLVVDHINRNSLNNRKTNLRTCTQAQNLYNKRPRANKMYSRYKGLTREKRTNKWSVRICKSGKSIHLGYFTDEIQAALTYDRKAKELFGEFAYLNFPESTTQSAENTRQMQI